MRRREQQSSTSTRRSSATARLPRSSTTRSKIGDPVASLFEDDDEVWLSKSEAFLIVAALMDALDLIDRSSPSFQVSWERLRRSRELLRDRIWPDRGGRYDGSDDDD